MHQIFLRIGNFTIYSYGVMMALAFLAGIFVTRYNIKRLGLDPDITYDLAMYIMISSIIGARIFYVLTNLDYYLRSPSEIIKVYKGGLVYYGGFIGALIGGIIFVKIFKLNFFKIADAVMPSLALGHSIGRIGCFLNGCCYGKVTDCFCGLVFPSIHDNLPHIPTQLISSFFNFLIFVFLFKRFKHRKFNGEITSFYMILYGIFRFTIEFFRGDPRGGVYFHVFSISQVISIMVFLIGITLYALRRKKRKKL